MRVAVVSDVHDNIWQLAKVLARLPNEAETLICCGDFCAPFTLAQIAEGFGGPIHVVFGNNDGDQYLLSKVAATFAHVTLHGDFAELELDGRRVAVTHYPQVGIGLVKSGTYDLVCYGHSHRAGVMLEGAGIGLNPGEVMGRFGRSTYGVYDTATGKADIRQVD
jgi:uncharacterized protein